MLGIGVGDLTAANLAQAIDTATALRAPSSSARSVRSTPRRHSATKPAAVGPDRAEAMVRDIMETRQQYIDKLVSDYDTYQDDLNAYRLP
mgnify:CR=1 FL=1